MTGPVFVDTNVFVYRHDSSEPSKQSRAEQWIEQLARQRMGRLSYQVLQELYATLTRHGGAAFDRPAAREIVGALATWQPVAVDLATLERAWRLQDRYSVSWWDALIVAAAQIAQCRVLLTEDLQDGQRFDAVQVVNPFASPDQAPAEILAALAA